MENKQFTQIENSVKAVSVELTPIFEEIGKLNKASLSFKNNGSDTPLLQLISRITKTARRHNIDTKVKLQDDDKEKIVGTNHNGLGYQENYSSQLTELSTEGYWSNRKANEKIIRDILFNSDAVVDLTATIKKSNQKTFMKVVNILKKYNLAISFAEFQEKNIDEILIDTDDDDFKIEIALDGNSETSFWLKQKGDRKQGIELINKNNKPYFQNLNEQYKALQDISKNHFSDLTINEVKLCFFLVKHKESMIKEIKAKRTLLNDSMTHYKDEQKELNDLLEPILTLEKL